MATTDTDVANIALKMVGAPSITSLDQGTPEADSINEVYSTVRDAAFQDHNWNFATKRVIPSKDSSTPVYGFAYQFDKPADYIKLVEIEDDPEYKIEGSYILCDQDPIKISYVYRNTSVVTWSPLFVMYFALLLASTVAEDLTQSSTLAEKLETKAEKLLQKARFADATEDDPEDITADLWIDSRIAGTLPQSGDL